MEKFTLTKEEFIARSMSGEVFIDDYNNRYFYDSAKPNPFRKGTGYLHDSWNVFDSNYEFTIEQPKPKIERRWKYRRDRDGFTQETDCYYTDEKAKSVLNSTFYKVEDCFIDVEVKDNNVK